MQITTMATSIFTGMIGRRRHHMSGLLASVYNHPGNFVVNLVFSEIGGKSHRTGHLYPSHVRISRLLSIAALLVFCQSCSLVQEPLGKVRCRSSTTSKSFAYAIYAGGPGQQSTSMHLLHQSKCRQDDGKKLDLSTKALLPCSQKKVNDKYLRKSIYNLHVAWQ